MATWQVQQAKSRLSELIEDAKSKGPQIITKHGSETAAVLSIAEYKTLKERGPVPTKPSLAEFLLSQPALAEDDDFFEIIDQIVADRALDTGREIDLDD
jgi:prevent-host-death family protein